MSGFVIYVQEGFGVDSHSVYFTNEAPTYETESIPVFARVSDTSERVQVGEREETFCLFKPLNGPQRQRGKVNRMPLLRVIAVVEQTNDESEAPNV